MLCQMMHIYSYRDVYAPDFSVLQVQYIYTCTHKCTYVGHLTLTNVRERSFHLCHSCHCSLSLTHTHTLSFSQLRLYQLSRLLHDELSTLHSHFTRHDITPFYYAAPWFLTLFASQYPIAFVARVMGKTCILHSLYIHVYTHVLCCFVFLLCCVVLCCVVLCCLSF